MAITRLNHAVLYVRDVVVTREFYENVLGFTALIYLPGQAAFFFLEIRAAIWPPLTPRPSPAGRGAPGGGTCCRCRTG